MRKKLTRLFLIAALLSGFLGLKTVVKAQHRAFDNGTRNEELTAQSDGWLRQVAEEPQSLGGTTLRTMPSSQRVVSSQTTRLLSTHGGKPTNHGGRWTREESSNLLITPSLLSCRHCSQGMRTASPRLYYVIALRRLLC